MFSRVLLSALPRAIVIVAALGFTAPMGRATAAPVIALSAEAGFGGYVKPAAWTPVRISVSNSGDGAEAEVLLTSSNSESTARSVSRVSLVRGARRTVTLYAPPGMTTLKVDVLIDGRTLATTSPSGRPLAEGDRLSLTVSEPLDAFNFLGDGRTPAGGRSYVAQARVEQLPESGPALDAVDVIVLNNVDTSQMSTAQRNALRAWLVSGGHLIVGGGPGARLTSAGLLDILPAAVEGALLNVQQPRAVMADFARPNSTSLTPTAILTANEQAVAPAAQLRLLLDDARVLASAAAQATQGAAAASGDFPLAVRRELGRGLLDQLAFDPAVGAWTDTNDARLARRDFFAALTGGRFDVPMQLAMPKSDGFALTASRSMPVSVLPPASLIALFLGVYVFAIGPLNFLVLRRLRRLEWAWVTIPALVTAFTLVGSAMGVQTRGNDPRMHRLSVMTGDVRVAQMRTNMVSGVFAPRRLATSVAVGNTLAVPLNPPNTQTNTRNPVMLEVSEPNRMDNVVVENNDVKSFYGVGNADAPRVAATLQFAPAQPNQPARVTGEISNGSSSDFRDCVLIVGRDYQAVGDLPAGATTSADVLLQQSAAQAGFALQNSTWTPPYRGYSATRTSFNSAARASQAPSSAGSRVGSFEQPGPPVLSALIGWRVPPSDRFATEAEHNLVTAMFDENMRMGDGVTLACWENVDHSGGAVAGATYIDRGVRSWRLPVQTLLLDSGTLPADAYGMRVTNATGASQVIGDGLTLDQGRHVVAFAPWLNVRTASITHTVTLRLNPTSNTTDAQRRTTNAFIFDWVGRSFTPVSTRGLSPTNEIRLTGPFVSPAGEVRLRLDAGNAGITLNTLSLSVDAGGR